MEPEVESGLREPVGGSMLLAMKFVTSITRDEDGMWIVECPAIPGCVSQGKTRAEALENARELESFGPRLSFADTARDRRTIHDPHPVFDARDRSNELQG